jgi:DNA-binding transcriptional LysR family regulator
VPLLVRETGSGSRTSLENHLKKIGTEIDDLRIVGEIGSSQALIQAVKAGMGLAFLSRRSVDNEITQGTLKQVRLKGNMITRDFYIITHRLRFNTRLCKTFIDFITR